MPRPIAQSSTVVTMAPDCATKATPPFAGMACANEALTLCGVERTPRQLGPMMRMRCGLAASSMACSSARPFSLPASLKPAVITTAALVPRAPSSAIRPGTVSGGVQITARSGVSGRDATSL